MLPKFKFQSIVAVRAGDTHPDNLEVFADCLETLRESIDLRPNLTTETRLELEESLAIAEAALRRAHMESKL